MIRKGSRLPREEFRARGYLSRVTPCFSVKIKKNQSGRNRLGVVVGVAAIKSAVKRNFFRRQAKGLFVDIPDQNLDILIIARPGCASLSRAALRTALREAIVSLSSNL
jgi:ribonuclease P protein component